VPTYGFGCAAFTVSPVAEIPAPAGSAATPNNSPTAGAGTLSRVQAEPSHEVGNMDHAVKMGMEVARRVVEGRPETLLTT
jgi:hypothetical protein